MAKCKAMTKTLKRCSRTGKSEYEGYCKQHGPKEMAEPIFKFVNIEERTEFKEETGKIIIEPKVITPFLMVVKGQLSNSELAAALSTVAEAVILSTSVR